MDGQITRTMTATIYVATATGRDTSGQPTWGTPAARSVAVEQETRIIPGANGEELKTSHVIFTNTAVGKMDRIWMPGDSSATASLARRPMLIEPISGELAGTTDHWEVYV